MTDNYLDNREFNEALDHFMDNKRSINSCPDFPGFGASYPDATCIDGYLWDLDSGEDGMLTHGGENPCPFCNTEAYLEWQGVGDLEGPKKKDVLDYIEELRAMYT